MSEETTDKRTNTYRKRRHADYKVIVDSPQGAHLLADLCRFCCANDSPFNASPFEMARNVGRLEVWLHIRRILGFDEAREEALMKEYESIRRVA